jgi:hypothetical protein
MNATPIRWYFRQTTRQVLSICSESIIRLNDSGIQTVPFISIAAPDGDTLQTRHSMPEPLKPIVPAFMTLCRGLLRLSSMTFS